MSGWRDQILQAFVPHTFPLTVVADPDALLLDEVILQELRARDFDLLPFADPVAFRCTYEAEYRSRWDRGEQTACTVILRSASDDLDALPYDLLQAGPCLRLSLAALFPTLSYAVIRALDRADLDALYAARSQAGGQMLGDNETRDFVLRHCFKIAPELITTPGDLLATLLAHHHGNHPIPPDLADRLIHLLRAPFPDWPLERIVPDRTAFLQFLQERWPRFLDERAAALSRSTRERMTPLDFEVPGPALLPLDQVRPYVDTLFLDRALHPVEHERADVLGSDWVAVGIRSDPQADMVRRVDTLLTVLERELPHRDAPYKVWFTYARRWGEFAALRYGEEWPETQVLRDRFRALRASIDAAFHAWVQQRYVGLHNQSQAMVHHIPRILRRHREETGHKIALVVIDGLSLGQWVLVRDFLQARDPTLSMVEGALFAWVPTITSVSRQALFAGEPPRDFPTSLHTTAKEETLWKQSWAGTLPAPEVAYAKGLGDRHSLRTLDDTVLLPKTRVAGLVVNTVDDILHGAELGMKGVYGQVRLWCEQGVPGELLALLLARGYDVFLTSDHGNVEARGIGRPTPEGVMADQRSERARIYPTEALRTTIAKQFADAISWPPSNGLPDNFWPLLAPDRGAFIAEHQHTVAHGGICIEEVIVPFIRIQGSAS